MSGTTHTGYPDVSSQPLLGRRNLGNLALLLAAPIPSVVATRWLFGRFAAAAIPPDPGWAGALASLDAAAAFLLHHPIACVNGLFFVNVCVVFWLLALAQRSSWLIDPYWTLIPLFIAHFYQLHPLAVASGPRSWLALGLLWIWSLRLTHNYLRREQWRLGLREDWRFAEQRARSRHFWWVQFFYVYAPQQVMLVGLTLPYWALHFRAQPFSAWDVLFGGLALTGLGVAHVADSSLDAFMRENAARVARGEPKRPLLDAGIWRHSRHPNYFGEQLFWWSVAGFGLVVGEPWVAVGTLFNSGVLAAVTLMTERRMLAVPARRAQYEAYRRRTSVWLPLPRRSDRRKGSDQQR